MAYRQLGALGERAAISITLLLFYVKKALMKQLETAMVFLCLQWGVFNRGREGSD